MKVLLFSYHFPPIGGAGAQRVVQATRHLPALGWEPIVLTGPGDVEFRWTPTDRGLAVGADEPIVRRVMGPEPPRSAGRTARLERWLGVKGPWQRWWTRAAVPAALELSQEVDVVHASLAPYQTAEALRALARRLDKPLVIDLEDPWALDEMSVYPSAVHRWLDLRRMRRTLRCADVVVMNTSEAADRVRTRFPELSRKVVSIPNGFDAADFRASQPVRSDDRFRIVHTGSFHTDLGWQQRRASWLRRIAGGTTPGVDFMTRSHVVLMAALEQVRAERPDLASHVELHLAGVLTEEDLAVVRESPLVRTHGFLPHDKTVELIVSADLLFLPLHTVASGTKAGLVPQKTYEYVASGRPILAAVPAGEAHDLLQSAGTAHVCAPNDAASMTRILIQEVERWLGGAPPRVVRRDVVDRYEASELSRRLAAVYQAAAEPSSDPAGAALSPVQSRLRELAG